MSILIQDVLIVKWSQLLPSNLEKKPLTHVSALILTFQSDTRYVCIHTLSLRAKIYEL